MRLLEKLEIGQHVILYCPLSVSELNITQLDDYAIMSSVSELTPAQLLYELETSSTEECRDTCIVESQCSAAFVAKDAGKKSFYGYFIYIYMGGAFPEPLPLP